MNQLTFVAGYCKIGVSNYESCTVPLWLFHDALKYWAKAPARINITAEYHLYNITGCKALQHGVVFHSTF